MPCWGWAPGGVPGSHPVRAPRREPCTTVHFISHFAGDRTELWMSPLWVLMKAISDVRASVTDAAPWVRQCLRGRGQPRDRSSGGAVETLGTGLASAAWCWLPAAATPRCVSVLSCLLSSPAPQDILRFSLRHCTMPGTDVGESLWAPPLMIPTVTKFAIYLHCLEMKKVWCVQFEVEKTIFHVAFCPGLGKSDSSFPEDAAALGGCGVPQHQAAAPGHGPAPMG